MVIRNCIELLFSVQIGASAQSEDNTAIYVMNNYFGIGKIKVLNDIINK